MSVSRRDRDYWQRLRRDKPSGFAALAAIAASGVVLIEIIGLLLPGSISSHRATPLYWALLIPVAWWAVSLVNYEPRVARTLVPACLLGPLVAIGCVALAGLQRDGNAWLQVGVATLSLAFGCAGLFFYSQSLFRREGPAR